MSIQDDHEAFILASAYGFCPPRVIVPDHTENLNTGKYEPDDREGGPERWMLLAQTLDATNILFLYEPDNLVE